MQHVILLKSEGERVEPALVEALRAAGLSASVAAGASPLTAARTPGESPVPMQSPTAVIYEVTDQAGAAEVGAMLRHAASTWPGALLVACRTRHSLDQQSLMRLGFDAVADELAQLPALLRELEGHQHRELTPPAEPFESTTIGTLLPAKLNASRLRAAFEVIAALHFATDQKSAAQTALAGLAPLVRAERWTIYLIAERGQHAVSFEPLASRGLTASERELPESDWRRALTSDVLLALSGAESGAVRQAVAVSDVIRKREGQLRLLAAPLVSGERVLGVIEAVREGDGSKSFTAAEAALLSALIVPLAAALANSVRIAEAELLSLTHDLTKLHNARFLRQFLTSEVRRARRYDSTVSTIFIDLDDFKEINDRHGHLAGSHVLMEMATVILTGVRDTDIVTRYGGDEFVVVLPETGAEMAARVAERIREKVAAHLFTGGRNLALPLTASFGVAAFPAHAHSPQQLLADADAAMYEAKAARKNCVRSATELGRR